MDTAEISFSDINAFNDGQRESFEDLICVLARREKPQGGIEYQPNEGRGGDGGVEAIWLLDNGKKVGYQAKFFLSLKDTQWRQMDESVQQALRVHPELQTYVFALPKDLTPNRGGKGKSEWQKWFDRIEKWKKWAAENSISIEFELWSETILKEMLLREGSSPLVRYWFGKDVLNPSWFKEQISSANRMLDDRFNPDDHVGVSIEELFDTIVRGPSIIEKLRAAFNQLETVDIQKTLSLSEKLLPTTEASLKVRSTWQKVTGLKDSLGHDLDKEWDVHSAKNTVDELRSELQILESDLDSVDEAQFSELNQHKLENVLRGFPDINSACYSLSSFFSQTRLQAEARRCAVIYGPAGAGKSHILGQVAEQRVGVGLPTVLVLGQSLSQSPFWEQIGSLLGLEGRSEESVLGTLNAAGERIGERTLLLFDAINEGVGAGYWRQKLPDIINAITRYPYLAAVFSCRDEYLQYAIPETLSDKLPKFRINGFSTPEELERAAIQYLDAKGIARPNTPWLSPEFSNPLFLKSASEAIHAKGLTEFPRGLRGISSIMAFYLDALSWRIGVDPSSQDDIAASIKRCACQIANKMAVNGCDFVEPEQATIFAEESFRGRTPPEGKTWLRILIEANLFRRDPPPYSDDIDPFDPPSDLIRFAFQRFQDHLMAKTLTEKITKEQAHAAFDKDGPLSFLCYDEDLDQGFQYKYAGLISALSTIYPEKLGLEFVHTLPDWERLWEEAHLLQEGFAESFKWRSPDAFPDSAIDLLNQLDGYHVDTLGVLLEVSMTAEHPFNALFLHTNLKRQAMPERDSQWTNWINFVSREELNQVDRVVSWALSISEGSADVKHMELASIVLAWALSSSFMTLRDRATKALTNLFVVNQDIYTFVLEKMYDCDDPYVIERLYAAAFGACCIDQDTKRLQRYSKETYNKVFAARKPPVAILTRDYALGIIELADRKGVLSSDIDLEGCFPPFDSDAPIFGLTEQDIESIADGRGGRDIFYSSSSELGDFGKYSIPGKVGAFISTALDSPAPIPAEDLKKQFLEEFIYPSDERAEALDRYESLQRSIGTAVFLQVTSDDSKETVEQDLAFLEESKTRALDHLESLLNETERMRLRSEYFREGKGYEEYDKVDLKQCRLWIAKRAYELGWTSELFPRDCYSSGYSRYDNDSERVGKKYQRIALDEIQARLADNFWALQDWSEELGVYRYSHQDFRRDIEPTILPNEASGIGGADCTNSWIIEPLIQLPRVAESDLKQWPFAEDPTQSVSEKLVRVDSEARRWLLLHEYHSDRQQYDEPHPGEHGIRYEELRFLYCVFLKRGNVEALAEHLTEKQSIDGHYFRPSEFTDGPYLREAYWRNTWQSEKLYQDLPNAPKGCEFLIPVTCYHWESHLDKSLPEGFSQYMPQKWFANELEVDMSDSSPNIWLDKTGQKLIQAHRPSANQIAVVIDENVLNTYCKKFGVEPVWIMIAERNVWPNGSNNESCSRRSEGMVWRENGNWKQTGWNQDTKR